MAHLQLLSAFWNPYETLVLYGLDHSPVRLQASLSCPPTWQTYRQVCSFDLLLFSCLGQHTLRAHHKLQASCAFLCCLRPHQIDAAKLHPMQVIVALFLHSQQPPPERYIHVPIPRPAPPKWGPRLICRIGPASDRSQNQAHAAHRRHPQSGLISTAYMTLHHVDAASQSGMQDSVFTTDTCLAATVLVCFAVGIPHCLHLIRLKDLGIVPESLVALAEIIWVCTECVLQPCYLMVCCAGITLVNSQVMCTASLKDALHVQ